MDLLTQAVATAQKERDSKQAPFRDIAEHMSKSERQVRRYFEDDSGITMDELDALVTAVAVQGDGDRMRFWHDAIARVDGTIKRLGHDPRIEADEAAPPAQPEESDPDSE